VIDLRSNSRNALPRGSSDLRPHQANINAEDEAEAVRKRTSSRLLWMGVLLIASAMYAAVVRPRMLVWGATTDEAIDTYPGDELVLDPDGVVATMAMAGADGRGRAGWYSWDRLDNGGEPSADRIVSE
jgi:hypothetical protein